MHGTGLWLGTPLDYLHIYLTYIMFAYQSLHFKVSFYFYASESGDRGVLINYDFNLSVRASAMQISPHLFYEI